jgi:anti-sigma regulatory factor (Ser/Thr protein kinase)
MLTPHQRVLALGDRTGVGEGRRIAARLARSLDFSETAAGVLAVVVTEAATNIVKHVGSGELVFRALRRGTVGGVEVLALDRGPGILNPGQAMRDGHSTAGSAGTGLGAMQRMAAECDVHSTPGKGVALRLVVWADGAPSPRHDWMQVGVVCLPKPGEEVSGDGWSIVDSNCGELLCVVDGLGHGPDAAAAAKTALAAVRKTWPHATDVAKVMENVHLALRPTRGAAVAVALLHAGEPLCSFCGVGNISAALLAHGRSRSMVSYNGILGHQARKIQSFTYPLAEDALCIVHSDGLRSRWRLEDYPGLERAHPGLIAAVLYRDYSRRRDDLAVVVARRRKAEPCAS